jgi:hypothetical protein
MYSTRYSCQILMKLEFSRCTTNIQISNFMKIRPVGAELLHAGGRTDRQIRQTQTDMTKLIVAFALLRTRLERSSYSFLYFNNPLCTCVCFLSEITYRISIKFSIQVATRM